MVKYKIILLLITGMVLTSCAKKPESATDKQPFMGVIEYKLTYPDGYDYAAEGLPDRMVATFRGDNMMMAMQVGESKIKLITNLTAKSVTSIVYVSKQFNTTLNDSNSSVVRGIPKLALTETEKLKKIAKHRCIKVDGVYKREGITLPFDVYYTPELSNQGYFWLYGLGGIKGIVLKFAFFDFGVKTVAEATEVRQEEVNPRVFEIPASSVINH